MVVCMIMGAVPGRLRQEALWEVGWRRRGGGDRGGKKAGGGKEARGGKEAGKKSS